MTARDQIQLAVELAHARSDIKDAQAGLQRFLDLIRILDPATIALLPAYRAKHFLSEAAAQIEQVGGCNPAIAGLPPSAQEPPEALLQDSPSPNGAVKSDSVIKTPADTASCEAEANDSAGEGVLSATSISNLNLKS